MFIGEFSPSVFFKVSAYLLIPTLPLIYYISQWLGHEPPFPKCWISDCAKHFPQFVFFRIATISGSVLLVLGWLTNHFYLKSISREAVFRIEKYLPEIPMVTGIMGGLFLMGSTANLDTGVQHSHWHTFCASRFFIFTLISLIYNTVLYFIIHSKMGKVNVVNLYFKLLLAGLIVLQLLISLQYGSFQEQAQDGYQSVNVALEWTLSVTVYVNFYSMGVDVEKFKFVYEMGTETQKEIDQVD